VTEIKRPTLTKIVIKNGLCHVNGKAEWAIPLSHEWTAGEVQSLVWGYKEEYEYNAVSEDHVKTIVNNYLTDVQQGSKKKKSEDKEDVKTNAELLMDLAAEHVNPLFKDQNGSGHAAVRISDHIEILPVDNSRFKRYLAKLFWDKYQKVVGSEALANAINVLQAKADHEGETYPLNLRVAAYLDSIYYDMTDEEWRSVKVNTRGWDIETDTPIIFTRHKAIAQVEPDRNYGNVTLDDFLKLTNVQDGSHQLLIKVYIVSLFVPNIAHVILNLYGDKGSAKSMLYTLIKMLVDPSKPTLLTLQKDRNEFIQQLSHNYLAYYDNTKHIPSWLSDESCRAVTGGGHTKRKLYTDNEDVVYEYKRCLGFNGINISLTQEDALDRSISIEMVRIPKDKRRLEAEILSKFEELKPKLLGYIFDILVKAMAVHSELSLTDLPRMADFAKWGEAIARAIGFEKFKFLDTYYDNIGRQNVEAIEAHPLGQAIAKFVQGWGVDQDSGQQLTAWEGTPLEILEILNDIANVQKIDTTQRLWPKAPNSLSRRLNEIRSNLLEGLNIQVTIDRKTTGDKVNTATIKVQKISPERPEPPVEKQSTLDANGDTGDTGDTGHNIGTEGGSVN
jgi:hypothetical protein